MDRHRRYWRELRPTLALAAPIIFGQLSQMAINVTDSVMIGRVGTVPLAASAFVGSVFGMGFILGAGLLTAVPVLVARARGAEEPQEAGEVLRHGVFIATIFSLLEMLVLAIVGMQLHRFGQPPEVIAEAGPYYALIVASLLPALVFQAFRQYAESLGRPWIPMAIMSAGVLLNVFLNWVFIYGKLGSPALGLAGAGIATLLARILSLVVLVAWLHRETELRPYWPARWRGALLRDHLRELLRIGVPAAGQLMFEGGAFTVAALIVGWLGAVSLAAHQIALSCAATTFMFTLGISSAASMRVAQAAGAGEHDRLRPIGLTALAAGLVCMTLFAVVFATAGDVLAGWFVKDAVVVELAANLLIVAAVFQVFDGTQVIGAGILRGLTDVRIPTAITFVAYWLIALPSGYWFGVRGSAGAVGVWFGLAAGLAFAAVFLALRFAVLTKGKHEVGPAPMPAK
ncbi:MATE family efflux transporter [Opitutaceae bacterium EW11]|nr:MATE family efflux transporter [Opitutaceae bacterium EW11]